jgi:hypothetical protein
MSVVEIPARLVPLLRRAMMVEMAGFGGDLEEACASNDNVTNPGRFQAVFAHIDASRAILDAVGWREPEDLSDQEPVALDLDCWRRHVVTRALRNGLDFKHEVVARSSATEGAEHRCEQARRDIDVIEEFLAVHDPSEG